jgi:hypothetical protein
MNKGDFVGGLLVVPTRSRQVMTLGGTPDNWICTWVENGETMTQRFNPEDLEPAKASVSSASSI